MARPMLAEGVGWLIVPPEDMMKFETIELLLKLSNLMLVCCHKRVVTTRLPHDLVDDDLRVTADVKPQDLELSCEAQSIDECLLLCHIVGCAEV
jgi:hypothetical protein